MLGFEMRIKGETGWGDAVCVVAAFVCTGIILAILSAPPIRSWGVIGIAVVVISICIATAKSRLGVILGVLAMWPIRFIAAPRTLLGSFA